MDAKALSDMRLDGRKPEICAILADYFALHLGHGDVGALAEGVRTLLEIDPSQAVRIWGQLLGLKGFKQACGPGLTWKLHRLEPSLVPWLPDDWGHVPTWIVPEMGDIQPPVAPMVGGVQEVGRAEPIEFAFRLECPWCHGEHILPVRRTLVFFKVYACPACDGPLKVDGRMLREHIPRSTDFKADRFFEERLHALWHDLYRAQKKHPAEAELLCQSFASQLTRAALASLSHPGR